MKSVSTKIMTRVAMIAAIYTSLTLIFAPISYGQVQFRISEALTILPLFCPEAILGLTIGCLLSNIFSPNSLMLDIVFGTMATLVAAILTYIIGKKIKNNSRCFFAILPPIIINAIVIPFTFLLTYNDIKQAYLLSVVFVGVGQAAVLIFLALPLYFSSKKILQRLLD